MIKVILADRCTGIRWSKVFSDWKTMKKSPGGAIPLLRGVEGCVIRDIGQHTPATTHPNTPPLKRGVVVIDN